MRRRQRKGMIRSLIEEWVREGNVDEVDEVVLRGEMQGQHQV